MMTDKRFNILKRANVTNVSFLFNTTHDKATKKNSLHHENEAPCMPNNVSLKCLVCFVRQS